MALFVQMCGTKCHTEVKKRKKTTEKPEELILPPQHAHSNTNTIPHKHMHRYSYTEPNIQPQAHSSCPLRDMANRPETNPRLVGPTEETLELINDGIKKENKIKGITEEYYRMG